MRPLLRELAGELREQDKIRREILDCAKHHARVPGAAVLGACENIYDIPVEEKLEHDVVRIQNR